MIKGIIFAIICIVIAVLIFCYYWRNSEKKFKDRSFFVRNSDPKNIKQGTMPPSKVAELETNREYREGKKKERKLTHQG